MSDCAYIAGILLVYWTGFGTDVLDWSLPEPVKLCDRLSRKEWVLGVVRATKTCPHGVHSRRGSEEVEYGTLIALKVWVVVRAISPVPVFRSTQMVVNKRCVSYLGYATTFDNLPRM